MKKLLIKASFFCCFSFFLLISLCAFAADFIVPNSGGEPVVIDVSNLNLLSGIDVSIGNLTNQPRPYRDSNTKSLVIFPPPFSNSEQTIQVRSGSSSVTKTINFRSSPLGVLKNSLLPDLQHARGGNSGTKISDGRIVLIGGSKDLASEPTDSIEIFDPEVGKSEFLKTPDELKNAKLKVPRSQHTATYIGITTEPLGMISGPVEQILVIGGFSKDGFLEDTIEVVEVKAGSNQCTSTLLTSKKSKLKKARIFHTSSLLPDGRILIVGGQGHINSTNDGALSSIEIYDPITKSVQASGISLSIARVLHTTTVLQDGNILIAGGFTNEKQGLFGFGPGTENAELIDVSNLTVKKIGSLVNNEGIGGHSATLLTNGLVVIFGGSSDFFSSRTENEFKGVSKSTVQFYNPANETFNVAKDKKSGGNLELQNARFLHKSVLLPNGNIAVIGGLNIKASSVSSDLLLSTPVSTIEVFDPDLFVFQDNSLEIEQRPVLETSLGRVFPTAILVTPKNKTQGFLSDSDLEKFVNSAIFVTGGFTNGFGKLPAKASELIQIEANSGIEGRKIKLTPEAVIKGSFLGEFLIQLDEFSKVPSLKIEPQTVNLSNSNNFMANIKVLSTNNEFVLLMAESSDSNSSIIVSPSLFQAGESINISRKDSSVLGEFEINFVEAESQKSFIEAKLKINVSDSAKPFLATVPGFGISLSDQGDFTSEKVQLKVFSQDGLTQLTSIPLPTTVTATISNPDIANLGASGISSVTGTLLTQFTVNAVKPGKTNLSFSINFPDILPVTIPIEVTGTPNFSTTPIDSSVLSNLSSNGIEISKALRIDSANVSLEDLRLSSTSSIFPVYVPINLQSSIDSSSSLGSFTIRPIFGIDLLSSLPRTTVNSTATEFRTPLERELTAIGGIVSNDVSQKPTAILASGDGIRSLTYEQASNVPLNKPLVKISDLSNVRDLKLFEFGDNSKIVCLKGNMVLLLNSESGDEETSATLLDSGFELELIKIDNQNAAVVSVGTKGVDLIFPVTDAEPRRVNFQIPGSIRHITTVEKLDSKSGPFVVAYDGLNTLSIVNLIDVNDPVKTITVEGEKISKIDYAGRFNVNGMTTDVLVASTQRKVLLFDLNNLTNIPVNKGLKIKNQIEDLIVIDGIAYLALGKNGIIALSVGSLMNDDNEKAEIGNFKKNKLTVIKPSGKEEIKSKLLNAKKLADSKPFLLSSGEGNILTVIRVSP